MYEIAANCENTEELEMFGRALEHQLDVFPDYVDCFCLRCQRHEVPITTPSVDATAANELTSPSPTAAFSRI